MTVDPDALSDYQALVFSTLQGAVTAAMVHLGDRLGLYRALAAAEGPPTAGELAAATGLHERWVREWAYNQGAAGLVAVVEDPDGAERIELPAEGVAVLADEGHEAFGAGSFHALPDTMRVLDTLPESFRTGVGFDYDAQGADTAVGMEREFEPWHRAHLVADVLPLLDGVVDRLAAGGAAADVGCGAGGAVLLFAEAFPASTFTGYDVSGLALERAEQRRAALGVTNASFADPRAEPLPADGSLAFVSTIECVHDMTRPQDVAADIRAALGDDGVWLLVDIKARDGYAANVEKNPMAAMMYGLSVLGCLPSALSEPDGAGLGTLGLHEGRARELATAAGFTRFRRLSVDHSYLAFYEIRP